MASSSSSMATIPLELTPLIAALGSALSASHKLRSDSLSQLQSWSTLPTFYPSLVSIFSTREWDLGDDALSIRLQAVVQFKNGIDKYWRRGAVNGISAESKDIIRPRLFSMIDEPDRSIAKNAGLCIAKIARLNYGFDWESLPSSLLSALQSGMGRASPIEGRLVLHRSLLFIRQTVKSLSSNRMAKGRVMMREFCNALFPTLVQLHAQVLQSAISLLQERGLEVTRAKYGEGEVEDLELVLLCFKSLSTMMCYGFDDVSTDPAGVAFFSSTITSFSTLLSLRLQLIVTSPSLTLTMIVILLTKSIVAYGKLYRQLLHQDVAKFLALGFSSDISMTYWGIIQGASEDLAKNVSDEDRALYPERLVVQSLLIFKSMMGDWASKSPIDVSLDFVRRFAEILVTKLLPLRPIDLEKWSDDPEDWMNEEEADRWEFELRPCAEHVLHSLLSQYRVELGPSMARMLQQASTPQSMEGLLLKEGIYCAFGRSPGDLEGSISFDRWLVENLIPEAAGTDSNYRIIRRRIAWLVGNWVGEDLPQATRTKIYSLLIHLISRNDSTDTAIRLTAARSLAKCDTWDFDQESFVPFLPAAIEEIVSLLGEVTLADSQMRLNVTLGVVIDRVGIHIAPYAPQLAQILTLLWSSASENHFQTSILVTLTKLVEALGQNSQELQPVVCPVVQLSTDPSRDSHVYLQEDGLELWHALLKRSNSLSPDMLSLLPLLVTLIAAGTDVLPQALKILESYLLLDASIVLQLCSVDLFIAFEHLLGELKDQAVKIILHSLNTLFQSGSVDSWANSLDSSQAFAKLLSPILLAQDSALIISKYLCTLARIVLASPDTFHLLVAALARRIGRTEEDLLSAIITCWIEKLDNISQGGQRKLIALALAYLISTSKPTVLNRLPELVSVWSSVMAETEETDAGDAELYRVPDDYASEQEFDYLETLESGRRQALSARDPVHTTKLSVFIRHQLSAAEALNGGPEFFQSKYLVNIDSVVLEELQQRLNGTLAG